jgi:hypothetical protein
MPSANILIKDLQLLGDTRFIVCTLCCFCVWPNQIKNHLQTHKVKHGSPTGSEALKTQELAAERWPLAYDAESAPNDIGEQFTGTRAAFPHLTIYYDGIKCSECDHTRGTVQSMKKHH